MDAEIPTDWTARCQARRCTGACVGWRVKADRDARQNRNSS